MIEIEEGKNSKNWENFSLVLPAVAVGNVGQLAIDLLLSTLDVRHIGYLHHPAVLPMIGPDPFDTENMGLITSWQVYECEEKQLVIVQQRSPIASGEQRQYIEYLIEWFQKCHFKNIILLSSSFSQFFTVTELESVPMHYLCTLSVQPEIKQHFDKLCWKEFNLGDKADPTEKMPIPGGGVTKYLFQA